MLLNNGASGIVNSQLVPLAPPQALSPPPALQPVIGQGAYANNLPGGGNMWGGALGGTSAAMTGATGGATSAEGSIAGLATDFSSMPFWKQPIFLTMAALIVGYLLLRYIHWT